MNTGFLNTVSLLVECVDLQNKSLSNQGDLFKVDLLFALTSSAQQNSDVLSEKVNRKFYSLHNYV